METLPTYESLVCDLAAGRTLPKQVIEKVLRLDGKQYDELVFDIVAVPRDRCRVCGARLRVRSSRQVGKRRVEYVDCKVCGENRGKRHVFCTPTKVEPKAG